MKLRWFEKQNGERVLQIFQGIWGPKFQHGVWVDVSTDKEAMYSGYALDPTMKEEPATFKCEACTNTEPHIHTGNTHYNCPDCGQLLRVDHANGGATVYGHMCANNKAEIMARDELTKKEESSKTFAASKKAIDRFVKEADKVLNGVYYPTPKTVTVSRDDLAKVWDKVIAIPMGLIEAEKSLKFESFYEELGL